MASIKADEFLRQHRQDLIDIITKSREYLLSRSEDNKYKRLIDKLNAIELYCSSDDDVEEFNTLFSQQFDPFP